MVSRDGEWDRDPHKGNLCSNLTQHCSSPENKNPEITKHKQICSSINSFRLQQSVKYPLPSLKFSWDRVVHQSESLNSPRPKSRESGATQARNVWTEITSSKQLSNNDILQQPGAKPMLDHTSQVQIPSPSKKNPNSQELHFNWDRTSSSTQITMASKKRRDNPCLSRFPMQW